MDVRIDEQTVGWVDGWMNRMRDGWLNRWMEKQDE